MAKKQVLIVDDEVDYLEILRDRLEFEGFEVELAATGTGGLEMMRANKPDVVLLDIMIPGQDGFSIFRAMLGDASLADIPVIFVSAYGMDVSDDKQKLLDKVPFLRKPFDVDELIAVIEDLTS
jgi:DNA-binding response OmpR family regulator